MLTCKVSCRGTLCLMTLLFGVASGFSSLSHVEALFCTEIDDKGKFDCYPEHGTSKEKCEARGCCWETTIFKKVPWCFYPKNYEGYQLINQTKTENGQKAFLKRTFPSPYPRDVKILKLDVEYQTVNRVRIKIADAQKQRYEAPYPKIKKTTLNAFNASYVVDIDDKKTGFKITRNDGDVLFDSQNIGGFIYSDQFLQISSKFEGKIYGLGEHRTTFWLDTDWSRYTLFAHDAPPAENVNLYGSHPFYLVMQPSGKSYGVFLHNSNAIDVILQPLQAITFRAIGGIFDFYVFTGPSPSDVIRQYTELIGRSFMPPYWSLGFHLCRFGYGSEAATRAVWERNRNAGIPLDVMWNDIDYMSNRNDFTIDQDNFAKLPELINDIHSVGMHYVAILDPGVSASEPRGSYPPFDDGVAMDIFVKDHGDQVFIGKVWNPNATAFPDFTNPKTFQYWLKQIRELHKVMDFDGLWIDMNEPSNFLNGGFNGCPKSELEDPPYLPGVDGGYLRQKTICMTAKQYSGLHYDVHNLYGISEHDMTHRALKEITGKRVFTLTRSSFPGTGSYGGHWSGDVYSGWHDLTKSIPEMLSFSLYGMSYTGADICGFNGNATESLCNRWMQLGAFYPFSRNHNSIDTTSQDPVAFGQQVIDSSIKALTIRYTLLPYLYTLFYYSYKNGETVVRPLFFEFPQDQKTHTVDRAFLWGSGLYIVPVTEDYSIQVSTYLPEGKWYDWYTGNITISIGQDVILNAPLDTIPLLVRGGMIFPTQKAAQTTTLSRQNKFTLMAFADQNGLATGSLFWDDGESLDTVEKDQYGLIKFSLGHGIFSSKVIQWKTAHTPKLDAVIIHGLQANFTKMIMNGNVVPFTFENNVLKVQKLHTSLDQNIELTWL